MKAKALRILLSVAAITALLLCCTLSAGAYSGDVRYTNPSTGYEVRIIDEYDLLTDNEEAALVQVMTPVTDYGHAVFWSTDDYEYDEIAQAQSKRYALYGYDSAGIFMINMGSRKVVFQSYGRIYDAVSSSYARSITDNVSGYASSGDYYYCAAVGYSQVHELLQGNRIAEPMKYISYIVIALMLAFVIVVGVVFSKRLNPLIKNNTEQVAPVGRGYLFTSPPSVRKIDTEMRLWVVILLRILAILFRAAGSSSSSGSSSSGRGGGSSGGGGGGGSSGGGGGGSSSF